MNRSNICTFIVSTLIGIPAYVNAQQISPNPNPLDSTITIDASAENSVDFANIGVISITNPGSLSNYSPSKWYTSNILYAAPSATKIHRNSR